MSTERFEPTAVYMRLFFLHQVWLTTAGKAGQRFSFDRVNFSKRDLRGLNLSHANLTNSVFNHCAFGESQFVGATLSNVKFHRCDMAQSDFTRAVLDNVKFSETNLLGASFAEVRGQPPESFTESQQPHLAVGP